MNQSFQEQLAQARRHHIIDAAITVVSEQGFQRTTIKQIARQAGIADGTIYNYFKNKDAILLGMIERISEAEVRELHFADAQKMSYNQFVAEYVAHRMQEIESTYDALKAIIPETFINSDLSQQIYAQIYEPSFAVAEAYLQERMNKGEIETADPKIAARLFASPLLGLLLLRLMGDEHISNNWDAYSQAVAQFLSQLSAKDLP